jgi:DNA invertase Pin-like site-specific DNA recombinase
LSAISQFERDRIAERVKAGLQRARAQGKRLGRPVRELPPEARMTAQNGHLSVSQAAVRFGVSRATAHRWLRRMKVIAKGRSCL